jgi:hypothetical protein
VILESDKKHIKKKCNIFVKLYIVLIPVSVTDIIFVNARLCPPSSPKKGNNLFVIALVLSAFFYNNAPGWGNLSRIFMNSYWYNSH